MQALLILSLCATSLGGTGALTALYYYFSKPSCEPVLLSKAGRARRVAARRNAQVELSAPEREGANRGAEFDSRAQEAFSALAAADALGRALDAASRRFDAPEPSERVLVQARPFEFSAFDE